MRSTVRIFTLLALLLFSGAKSDAFQCPFFYLSCNSLGAPGFCLVASISGTYQYGWAWNTLNTCTYGCSLNSSTEWGTDFF